MKLRCLATCMAVACLATVGAEMAFAQANFFVPPGGTGLWSDPTNWTLGHLPQTGETAIVQSSRVATIDIVNPSTFDYLRIADNDTGPIDGTLNILPGASLNVAQQVLVGLGGPSNNHGVVNQSGGSLTVGDALFIAFDSSHTAEYNLSGGTVTTGNLWFRFGNGTLTQTGGTMNAQQLVLAEGGNPLSSSLYDLQGGLFNVAGREHWQIARRRRPIRPFFAWADEHLGWDCHVWATVVRHRFNRSDSHVRAWHSSRRPVDV